MKRSQLLAICALAALFVAAVLAGMMPGKSDAECTRACVKHGAKFAVVAGGQVYVLAGKTSAVSALAGKKATVSGELTGNTLTVNSVVAAK